MKADIHPEYRAVVFQDTSSGESWITRSTIETDETIKWEDGQFFINGELQAIKGE